MTPLLQDVIVTLAAAVAVAWIVFRALVPARPDHDRCAACPSCPAR